MSKDLTKLIEHNLSLSKNGVGTMSHTEVKDQTLESLEGFAKNVQNLRRGTSEDSKGNKINPIDLSLDDAIKVSYGCDTPQFLSNLGIFTNSMSLETAARELGCDNLTNLELQNLMISHGSFSAGSPAHTNDISSDHRFIIPELITSAIRVGYEHTAMHNNWTASTQNMSKRKVTMPQILRGDGQMTKINEGADIPMGSVQFGQKEANTFKVGTGFAITDELVIESTLDMLFLFMQEVGNDMSIGADVLALDVLLKGEQSDLSESAPVVGVNTPGQFTYKDIKRVFTRMKRLGQPASRIITGEEDGIDITDIDKFQGFDGPSKLANIRSILGVPEVFDIDTHGVPDDQAIFVNPTKALVKLKFRGMITEKRRNPRNQTEEMFISDHIGFAIIKRDARVILDKSLDFSVAGFPDYMDIDARIKEGFKNY